MFILAFSVSVNCFRGERSLTNPSSFLAFLIFSFKTFSFSVTTRFRLGSGILPAFKSSNSFCSLLTFLSANSTSSSSFLNLLGFSLRSNSAISSSLTITEALFLPSSGVDVITSFIILAFIRSV